MFSILPFLSTVTIPWREFTVAVTSTVQVLTITIAPTNPEPGPGPGPPYECPKPTIGIFVSPTGSPSGAGTMTSPISLASAIQATAPPIGSAQTRQIWLRGGTYTLDATLFPALKGTPENPWIVSAYPCEEPVLDVNTALRHGWLFGSSSQCHDVRFEGIEFTDTRGANVVSSYNLFKVDGAKNIGWAHCSFHDGRSNGIIVNSKDSSGFWFYQCLVWNNGRDAQFEHGAYVKNNTGLQTWEECIFSNNAGHHLHAYNSSSDDREAVNGFRVLGCTFLTYGTSHSRPIILQDDAGTIRTASDNWVVGCAAWNARIPTDATMNSRQAVQTVNPRGYRLEDCTLWNTPIMVNGTGEGKVLHNTVHYTAAQQIVSLVSQSGASWERNAYSVVNPGSALWLLAGSARTFAQWRSSGFDQAGTVSGTAPGNRVVASASRYDTNRVMVSVLNFERRDTVEIDLSGKLPAGNYEVRPASSPKSVVVRASYSGHGPVSLPMAAIPVAPQLRPGGFSWQPSKDANAFLIRRVP